VVVSGYTLEDAELSKPLIDAGKFDEILLVTSDFHMPRAQYLFEKVFGKEKVIKTFPSKPTTLGSFLISKVIGLREKVYLKRLKANP
jgi:uncharacterized SAM-binding protein YcdF (DUF218 family)